MVTDSSWYNIGEFIEKNRISLNTAVLSARLANARSSFTIYKSISRSFYGEDHDCMMPNFSFWFAIMDSCMYRTLMEIAKAYEKRQGNISLYKLLNQVEQAKKEDSARKLVRGARAKYDMLKDSQEKLFALRDCALAHADKYYLTNLGELLHDNGLKMNEIEELLETAEEICNDILVELTGCDQPVSISPCDDGSSVIADVRMAYKEREKASSEHDEPHPNTFFSAKISS